MNITWKYVKTNLNHKAIIEGINEFESKYDIKFPSDFIQIIRKYNNGYPVQNLILINKKEKQIKKLLSFDKEDRANMFSMYSGDLKKDLPEKTIPFLQTVDGDFFCFDFNNNGKIVYFNNDNAKIEKVCDNFNKLLSLLYEDVIFDKHTPINDPLDINFVERKLGVVFPKEYKEIVLRRNRGKFKHSYFKTGDSVYPLDHLYSFNPVDKNSKIPEILEINSNNTEYGKEKKIIAFAVGAGSDRYCFDFNNMGKIVYYNPESDNYDFHVICDSFKSFLNLITTKFTTEEDDYLTEENPSQEVMIEFDKIDNCLSIIDNLKHIQANIKKFGVTKELIHLVNTDNQLGRELSISLPYYESDEEEINEEELPDSEELIAATEGIIGKAKDGIVAAFKWLKEKIVGFFKWLWDLVTFKKNRLKREAEKLEHDNLVKKTDEMIKKTMDELTEMANRNPLKANPEDAKKLDEILKSAKAMLKKDRLNYHPKKVVYEMISAFNTCIEQVKKIKVDPKTGQVNLTKEFLNSQTILGFNPRFIIDTSSSKDDSSLNGFIQRKENEKIDRFHARETRRAQDKDYEALTVEELDFDGIDDFKKIGKEIEVLSDKIKTLKIFVTDLTKVCDEQIKASENEVKDIDVVKKIKNNTKMAIAIATELTKTFTDFSDDYIRVVNKIEKSIVTKAANEMKSNVIEMNKKR